MFISKKTSIQPSWFVASRFSPEKGDQQSSQTLQNKTCFFKIFVTDSKPKFFCYPAGLTNVKSDSSYSGGSKIKLLQAFPKIKRLNKQNYFYKKNFQIIRPLLYLSRTQISLICKKLLIPVYPDKSNQYIKYSRNRIRKQLLPSLKLFYNPQIEQALFQFSEFLCKEQNFISLLFNAVPHNFLKIVKEKNTK